MIALKDVLSLTKFNLSAAVTLSAVFAYLLFKGGIGVDFILPTLAVLSLAMGVSALNQCQEYQEDAKMQRTKNRPLAAKRIQLKEALFLALGFISFAMLSIYLSLDSLGVLTFIFVIVTYNLIYTKAKKISVYAAVYGSILGVVPPFVGWIAAGGEALDVRFLSIGLLYLIWQIPHFWLLVLKYHKEYQGAGFPTVAQTFGVIPLERITFIWLLFTLICGVFSIAAFEVNNAGFISFFFLLNVYMLYSVVKNLRQMHNHIRVFIGINMYIVIHMSALVLYVLFF